MSISTAASSPERDSRLAASAMRSAASSPETTHDEDIAHIEDVSHVEDVAHVEDVRPGSSGQPSQDDSQAPATRGSEIDEDAKSDVSTISSEQTGSQKKTPGRKAMAAVMSGLEGRLFPRSLSRGRESSRGESSRRSSSLDLRSPPSASELSRSTSPANRTTTRTTTRTFTLTSESQPTLPTISTTSTASNTENTLKMEGSHNKSDEALVKPSSSMPSYVQPTEHGESGERLAKDVFDRDNTLIESSSSDDADNSDDDDDDDDDYEGSDEEESIPGVTFVTVPRGRTKNKKDDITSITASDFAKAKDASLNITEQRKYQSLFIHFDLDLY
jgi:hypothetical protein